MITVKNIIGKSIAVLSSDGLKLYNAIVEDLAQKKNVIIDFDGLDQITSSFLNASIGKIWMNAPELAESLNFKGTSTSLKQRIELVKENALNKEKSLLRDEAIREYMMEA